MAVYPLSASKMENGTPNRPQYVWAISAARTRLCVDMAEEEASILKIPENPLLQLSREKGFIRIVEKNLVRYIYTDLSRVNGSPTTGDSSIIVTTPPHEPRPAEHDSWTAKEIDGRMCIWPSDHEQALPAEAKNVVFEGPSGFCDACYSAIGYLTGLLQQKQEKKNENEKEGHEDEHDDTRMSVVHHWNLMSLHRAAASGCPLCKTLWSRCFDDFRWAFSSTGRIDMFWTSDSFGTWDGSTPGDARLTCALFPGGEAPIYEETFLNIFRFQLWPSPRFDDFFAQPLMSRNVDDHADEPEGNDNESEDRNEEDHNDDNESDASSNSKVDSVGPEMVTKSTRGCQSHAVEWLSRCKANDDGKHDACNTVGDPTWRPTRLLDLSTLQATGKVRLACRQISEIDGGKDLTYITLSHCWGKWGAEELERLTQSKLDLWQTDGIDLDSLPLTFRDAIDCASWFNVRWLWIDSMCIIQDSPEDWDREALLMCEVYKYALLNISADDSIDAREGCFRDREPLSLRPFKLHMPNMDTAWWMTVDERSLFEWVEEAPISKRAWVYQERQLSRRVLHFTKHEVFWECCAAVPSFACETYPKGSPLTRDFVGQAKIVIPPVVGDRIALNSALSKTWDAVCEEYSSRFLSYRQDKLPALAGLAKEFGNKCPSDTYLAGMWSSTLPQQLNWEVKVKARPLLSDALIEDYIALSWTWLSVDTEISMPQQYWNHSLIDIVDIQYHTHTTDPYGKTKGASLKVRALTRSIFLVTTPSPFEGTTYDFWADLGLEKGTAIYAEGSEERKDNRIGYRIGNAEPFREREDYQDVRDTRHYLCMLTSVSQYDRKSARELKGLLLEPTEEEGRFRRAGVIHLKGECALRMRYILDDDDPQKREKFRDLWQQVSPNWGPISDEDEVEDKERRVSPEDTGPMSLYELDIGAEHISYERLVSRELTLV